ncbi:MULTISPECIES: AraC family ligand binding domain-containing protein [unclassified Photobacterium]|uniref:AraC family ligand binding domain-containing protein n=1 Tax=unclassified Photobacterium TaxID=2628852 RepID=UPI002ED130F9
MKPDNSFQFITSPHLAGVTLLHATMSDFSYDKHAHEEYAIGVTLKGRQDFFCQRAFHRSPPGGVLIFNPEDVHDGCSGDTQELEYRMLIHTSRGIYSPVQSLRCTSGATSQNQRYLT